MDEQAQKPANQEANKTKILVVEDDPFVSNLLIKNLLGAGYVVINATEGQKALTMLETEKPQVILLDLLLPGLDGFEVLKRIKANAAISNIPVIILSNLGSQDDINKALQLGASDYIIKANFTLTEIVERIKTVLK